MSGVNTLKVVYSQNTTNSKFWLLVREGGFQINKMGVESLECGYLYMCFWKCKSLLVCGGEFVLRSFDYLKDREASSLLQINNDLHFQKHIYK